jgi:Uma2 family endonuclease
MGAVADKTLYTPDDLLSLPDEKGYELVDGELVERTMGAVSSWVGTQISHHLNQFVHEHRLGWVLGADCGYHCFPDSPNTVRRPDVSFVRSDRLPDSKLPTGYFRLAPDLAVEVISPNDLAYDVEEKIREYLKAGIRLIWIVYPQTMTVTVYRPDGSSSHLGASEELSGEDVIPGFRCAMTSIFPPVEEPSIPTQARPADPSPS